MFDEGKTYKGLRIGKDLLVWGFVLAVMAAIAVGDVKQGPVIVQDDKSVGSVDVEVSGGEVGVSTDETSH